MAVTNISFFYEKEKIKILQDEAEAEGRPTSSYVQNILETHVEAEHNSFKPITPKKVKQLRKRRIS